MGEKLLVLQEKRTKCRCGKTKDQKHRGQAHYKEQRRNYSAPVGSGFFLHLIHRDPTHIGQIWRHDGQDTGAEKGQKPRQQRHEHGGQKTRVNDFDSEHKTSVRAYCRQVLRMQADDPAAVVDVPHFCNESGHALLEMQTEGAVLTFLIRRA